MAGPRLARATAWAARWAWPEVSGYRGDVRRLSLADLPTRFRVAHCGLPAGPDPRMVVVHHPAGTWFTLEVRGPHPRPAARQDGAPRNGARQDWDGAMALDRVDVAGRTVPLPLCGDTDLVIDVGEDRLVLHVEDSVDGVATAGLGEVRGGALTRGYDLPRLSWRVAGRTMVEGMQLGDPPVGDVAGQPPTGPWPVRGPLGPAADPAARPAAAQHRAG